MILNQQQPTVVYGQWFADSVPPPPNAPTGWKFKLDGSDWSIVSGLFLCIVGAVENVLPLMIAGEIFFCGGIFSSYVRKRKEEARARNPFSKHIDWHHSMDGSDWATLVGIAIVSFSHVRLVSHFGFVILLGGILRSFVLKRSAETMADSMSHTVRCSQVRTIIIPPTPVRHHQYPAEPVRNVENFFVRPPVQTPVLPPEVPSSPPSSAHSQTDEPPFEKIRRAIPQQLLPPMMGIHSSVGPKESPRLRN